MKRLSAMLMAAVASAAIAGCGSEPKKFAGGDTDTDTNSDTDTDVDTDAYDIPPLN